MRLFAGIICLFILTDCTYDSVAPQHADEAVITGYDGRYCIVCCGGLVIYFDKEANQPNSPFHLIDNHPSDLGIDSNSDFPLNVTVLYSILDKCGGLYINVICIEIK